MTEFCKSALFLVLTSLLVACAVPAADSGGMGSLKSDQAPGAQAGDGNVRNFVLLRHAEKESGPPDPALSPQGVARSAFFAGWLYELTPRPEAIWSSDYVRTRTTAGPVAERLALDIQIYDPRDLPALAATLVESDLNAVVIGHSNTTPELAALLCRCEVASMNEDNYETGYLVRFVGDQRTVTQFDFKEIWTGRPAISD